MRIHLHVILHFIQHIFDLESDVYLILGERGNKVFWTAKDFQMSWAFLRLEMAPLDNEL